MQSSRRRLPHHYPRDGWVFVTWHLHGSLPQGLCPPPGKASAGKAFVWMDRYLDTTPHGPMFLRNPKVADLVAAAIERGATLGSYDLRAFVVMGNHVHVLLRPKVEVSRILQWLKGATARETNLALGRTGRPFWQRESYDHWVRNVRELDRIAAYVENNPVKAGLVTECCRYPWSSASPRHVKLKRAAAR